MSRFKRNILIFSIIFMPITFSLGLWQVDRANQKTEIINSYDSIINNPAVEFKIKNDFINWQPVYLTGEFTDIILYEDNALLSGKAGFKIYHLFKTIDTKYEYDSIDEIKSVMHPLTSKDFDKKTIYSEEKIQV